VAGRVENLKPWKPGQSGNPGGRPKGRLIDEALEELLLSNDSELALAIAKKLLARAKTGEVKAIQLVAERVQGKPKRQLELSGPDGGPLDIHNMTDEELNQRIAELMEELGLAK
jgi:HPt (histidine-containing phosphotransfer) domain-containing protein